jgi:hypothetical protein
MPDIRVGRKKHKPKHHKKQKRKEFILSLGLPVSVCADSKPISDNTD